MDAPRILLVEDDLKLSQLLAQYLEKQGFILSTCNEGQLAPQAIIDQQPELVVLDLMLPGMDGLSICREVRTSYQGKILVLTASDDDMDQVAALEMGADDFVTKPLQPRVLLARIRMLLRRNEAQSKAQTPQEATPENDRFRLFGALSLDRSTRACNLSSDQISLTPSEFDLLWFLACHPDEILSRDALVKATRGIDYDGIDRTIDNKIVSLRKKLQDNPAHPRRLITVRGKGYLFVPDSW